MIGELAWTAVPFLIAAAVWLTGHDDADATDKTDPGVPW